MCDIYVSALSVTNITSCIEEDRIISERKIIQGVAVGGHVLIWDMTVIVTFTMGECGISRRVDDGSRKASRNGSQDIANTNQSTRRFVVIDECTWPPTCH